MRLKNVLIVVNDIEKSLHFYKTLFGLDIVLQSEGNVILTEGLVLQERRLWEQTIEKAVAVKNHSCELYFVENEIEAFVEKLEHYSEPIEYVTTLSEQGWGHRAVRFYDLDGNLIEVGTKR